MADTVLFNKYNGTTRRRTKIIADQETGLPLIMVHHQDVRPIVEDNKRLANNVDRHDQFRRRTRGAGMVQVASIPNIIYWRLARMGITRDPKALRKWLSRRDARLFRTDDGRNLA